MFAPFEVVIPSLRINFQETVFDENKNLYTMISITLFSMKKKEATQMFNNRGQESFVYETVRSEVYENYVIMGEKTYKMRLDLKK